MKQAIAGALASAKVQPAEVTAAQAALQQAQARLQALQAPPAPQQVAFTQPQAAGVQQNHDKNVATAQAQVGQAQAKLAKLQQALADANAALAAAQKRAGDAQQNLANVQQSTQAVIAAAQARVAQAQAELARVRAGGAAEPGWMWPTFGTITSPFGLRNMSVGHNHNGVDVANAQGTPIAAAHDGVVTEAGWCHGYGYCVKMSHPGGFTTEYGHMASPPVVKAGQQVRAGTLIGLMGTTYDAAHGGFSTGVHLHFTLRLDGTAIDPLLYLP
jgi:murein DD-endopeptidase MepM/ murein hydrolase activator NlpD